MCVSSSVNGQQGPANGSLSTRSRSLWTNLRSLAKRFFVKCTKKESTRGLACSEITSVILFGNLDLSSFNNQIDQQTSESRPRLPSLIAVLLAISIQSSLFTSL